MFGSAILDVGIGLVVIYIVFSLIGSTITEAIAQTLNLRGKNLVEGIKHLLNDPESGNKTGSELIKDLEKKFMNHPLVRGLDQGFLSKGKGKPGDGDPHILPDYISSDTFTTVVSDLLELPQRAKAAGDDLEKALESLPDGKMKVSLVALFHSTKGKAGDFEKRVSSWYDEAMERVSALYKRKAHLISFLVAVFLVLVFNVDSLYYGNSLYENSNLRQAVASIGQQMVATGEVGELNELLTKVDEAELPIGWSRAHFQETFENYKSFISKFLGLLISIFAVSLGGPFWFQILNKLVNLKSSGIEPLTMEERERLKV